MTGRAVSEPLDAPLVVLNGEVTHEAARVGPYEPIYKYINGPQADADKAIHLAYLEILTRRPDPRIADRILD